MNKKNNNKRCVKRRIIRRLYMQKNMNDQTAHDADQIRGLIMKGRIEEALSKVISSHNGWTNSSKFLDDTIELLENHEEGK